MSKLTNINLNGTIYDIGSSSDTGLTADIKTALLQIANKCVYKDDGAETYCSDLYSALYPPTGITLNTSTLTLSSTGDTAQLTATVLPEEALQDVAWTTSNGNIASVNSTGLVTYVSDGSCTIMATTGDVSASCSVQCGALPLYTLETATDVLWKDRYNAASSGINVSVSDGNHIKLVNDGTSTSWYDGANLSTLATNGINGRSISNTWFTLSSGDTIELKLANIVGKVGWNANTPRFYLLASNDTAVLSGSVDLRPSNSNTDPITVSTTLGENVAVTCLALSMQSAGFVSTEFDVMLYVNGVRYV